MRFYCRQVGKDGRVNTSMTIEAPTAIEALRAAALKSRHSGTWEAYSFVTRRDIDVKRHESYSVTFKPGEA